MPTFYFFVDKQDQESILQAVFQSKTWKLIPDGRYRSSTAQSFTEDCAEFRNNLHNWKLFICGSYTRSAVTMREYDKGKFYIDPKSGGPLLELALLMEPKIDNGIAHLRYSIFSHNSYYWDDPPTMATKASDELKTAYRELVKVIKKHLKKLPMPGNIWVGHHTLSEIEAGRAKLFIKGVWWPER